MERVTSPTLLPGSFSLVIFFSRESDWKNQFSRESKSKREAAAKLLSSPLSLPPINSGKQHRKLILFYFFSPEIWCFSLSLTFLCVCLFDSLWRDSRCYPARLLDCSSFHWIRFSSSIWISNFRENPPFCDLWTVLLRFGKFVIVLVLLVSRVVQNDIS